MPEKIEKELDKWEEHSKKTIQKLRKLPGRASKEIREEYRELRDDGQKLVKQIDKQIDKAGDKTRDALKKLRKRAQKAVKELTEAWSEMEEIPAPIEL